MSDLRLAVFDCDGTLLDSLNAIHRAMDAAFTEAGLAPPTASAVRGTVGLSVPQAVAALAPNESAQTQLFLDRTFRSSSMAYRESNAGIDGALYPGTVDALARLDRTGALMAVATGKARRGLEHTLDTYDLRSYFIATQTADDAPSKPHPGMLENCERMTGVAPSGMIMIGDTTFDILMAREFGCASIGVSWGYHSVEALREAGADVIIDGFEGLDTALESLWGGA